LRERFDRWRTGDFRTRKAWRERMMERNPVAWLEGRDSSEEKLLWTLFLISAALLVMENLKSSRPWRDADLVLLWGIFGHYVLCLWIAVRSPRRLADDKHSGALEVLLCTPFPPVAIVRGSMTILWRRFGRLFLVMLTLDLLLIHAYFRISQGAWNPGRSEVFYLTLCGLVAFPLQAYSLARVGLYQGLVQGNSLRATFMLVWKAGLLPWGLWLAFLLTCEFGRRRFSFLPRVNDAIAFSSWALIHVLVCGSCLAHANWHLRRNFRLLAAQPAPPPFWRRWASALARSAASRASTSAASTG
jgi:hypothetical protein